MNASSFDTLVRALTDSTMTRRLLTRGLAGMTLAVGLAHVNSDDLEAKKRNKRKKRIKKSPVNEFGCRNVGVPCKNGGQCCSGICTGKRRKKTCRAHDTGGCQVGGNACNGGFASCVTSKGESGVCEVTTGNAGYCARESVPFACTKDADCVAICGPGAACGRCAIPGQEPFTFCAGIGECGVPKM